MNEVIKQTIFKLVLPVLVPVAVGLGSAVIATKIMVEKLDTRVSHLEVQIKRHEKALDKDFARHEVSMTELSHKTDDQEKRLTRLETLVNETQVLLTEIRADVKILLRGGQQ